MNTGYALSWTQVISAPEDFAAKARNLARHAALDIASVVQRRQSKNFLRLLYCHYVFDDQLADFDLLISKLKSVGTFVNTDTCVDMISGQRKIEGRIFHLSFDDGFRNIYTNAFPVMRQHGIQGAFFVPTAVIGADMATSDAYCQERLHLSGPVELATWDDLAEMFEAGIDIGSHTRNHARFTDISASPTAMQDEIFGSKQDIETRLGGRCQYIAWPYGRDADVDERSLEATRAAGYRACFGAFRGTARLGTDLFRIPRHHFEVQWPRSHVLYFARGKMER